MTENAVSGQESRSERLCGSSLRTCSYCGEKLPDGARVDMEYCGGKCRKAAWSDKANTGKVTGVRLLKCGLLSVSVYVESTDLKPGDVVKVGEWND